eukprot:9464442-Pyramimonas_sp.AAC.1
MRWKDRTTLCGSIWGYVRRLAPFDWPDGSIWEHILTLDQSNGARRRTFRPTEGTHTGCMPLLSHPSRPPLDPL